MKIIITGGDGYIGSQLILFFKKKKNRCQENCL